MKNRIFVDGMENISLNEGLVRMNFNNIVDRNGESEVTNELIMTPVGFLKAFGAMEDLVNKLIADGVITRHTKQEEETEDEIVSDSPNFG